jgi:branched-chain amino acid aminotransferase/4-amino-4-deoxychorismate lyase
MKAIFNNEIINDKEITLGVEDRAIQYGDGIFETIIVRERHSTLIKYHYHRLKEGAAALNFRLPHYFNIQYLESSILKLIRENDIKRTARIKVLSWRKKGGYYTPESQQSNILIHANIHHEEKEILRNVGISKTIRNHHSPYSQFKTMNSLKYILASMEKEDSGFDDLIILNERDHVSELLYSNIFWIKNNVYYTPSLETGCIKGVMRSYLIDRLEEKGLSLREVHVVPEELLKADHVFATNASGIRHIIEIADNQFEVNPHLSDINTL